MIPYGQHYVDDEDIEAVVKVLKTGALTQGPVIYEFESAIAEYVGAKYAVAVSSGTAALHLACIAADFKSGDNVITSANTFVASANCVLYQGANPYFTDISDTTLNMDPNDLSDRCKTLKNIAGVIPVHFAGNPCDMQSILDIAKQYKAKVIEDASHALGAQYNTGEMVGSCVYSDMTTFSFHPVKGVTAGEGGVITTNDYSIYKRLLNLRSHGICKGNFDIPGISKGDDTLIYQEEAIENGHLNPWYYEMQELGFNYRITDFQCALALSQLKKSKKFIQRRQEIANIYDSEFSSLPEIKRTQLENRANSSLHLYVLRINFDEIGKSRGQCMRELFGKNIGTQVHYIPVPFHPFYAKKGFNRKDYPIVKSYYEQALSIPIYYELTNEMVNKVANSFVDLIKT